MVVVLSLVALSIGLYSAYTVDHAGHHITGMNNHVVWGLPHVFAISLIVTASGALNGATLASVFGNPLYKPVARLSVLLAICLLVGGLMVLVLDLGRPDRLIVAMTYYNFSSIFTWNIFLYTGFIAIGIVYLWFMLEKKRNVHVTTVGRAALLWRLILTSGTGSIFGFLVGRDALDTAILAPLFIALSLVMGTASLVIGLHVVCCWQKQKLDTRLIESISRFMIWFLLALGYFSIVHHVTNLYVVEHLDSEQFTLTGAFSMVFWGGHVLLGIIVPLVLIFMAKRSGTPGRWLVSAWSALVGGGFLVYVIVVGSQSTPQKLFPGYTVTSSSFGDAGFVPYDASMWEWSLGFGGIALASLLCVTALKILPLVPDTFDFADSQRE